MLYDHKFDYDENINVVNDPEFKEVVVISNFVAKLCVVLNFCILINNELTPVQKFKTP
jgi:hypothetical protein